MEVLEKLNEAQHLALIGSWEWNLQTNSIWWSDETYRIFGVTAQDFVPALKQTASSFIPMISQDTVKHSNILFKPANR